MQFLRIQALVVAVLFLASSVGWSAQKKRKKGKSEEEITQVLEIPKDPRSWQDEYLS